MAELTSVTLAVRCPYPGHRWRRGDTGPCGLKLGELRRNADGTFSLSSLSLLLDQGDGHYEVLGKPTRGAGADLRSSSGADSVFVPSGGDLWLRCPQCGVETHLSTLTTLARLAVSAFSTRRSTVTPRIAADHSRPRATAAGLFVGLETDQSLDARRQLSYLVKEVPKASCRVEDPTRCETVAQGHCRWSQPRRRAHRDGRPPLVRVYGAVRCRRPKAGVP